MGCSGSKGDEQDGFDGLGGSGGRRKSRRGGRKKSSVGNGEKDERAKDAAKRKRVTAKEFASASAAPDGSGNLPTGKKRRSSSMGKKGGKRKKGDKGGGASITQNTDTRATGGDEDALSSIGSVSAADESTPSLAAPKEAEPSPAHSTPHGSQQQHLSNRNNNTAQPHSSGFQTPSSVHSLATPDTTDSEGGSPPRAEKAKKRRATLEAAAAAAGSNGGGPLSKAALQGGVAHAQSKPSVRAWATLCQMPSASQLCSEDLGGASVFESPEIESTGRVSGGDNSRDGEEEERGLNNPLSPGSRKLNPQYNIKKKKKSKSDRNVSMSTHEDGALEAMLRGEGGGSDAGSDSSRHSSVSSANSEWMYDLENLNKQFEQRSAAKAELEKRKMSKSPQSANISGGVVALGGLDDNRTRINSQSTDMAPSVVL